MDLTPSKKFTATHITRVNAEICDDIKTVNNHIESLGHTAFTIVDVVRIDNNTKEILFYVPPDKFASEIKN